MPTPQRKHAAGVIDHLLAQPQRFRFAQLINLLLRQLRRQGVPYERAFAEVLRFRTSASLAFPASEVQAVELEPRPPDDPHAAAQALLDGQVRKLRITPAFIGLLGASGALPLHDTERIAARQLFDGDASQRDLADLFSHRMAALFYEAWGKYRVEHGIDTRGRDRLLPMLLALAGRRARSCGDGVRVRDEVAAYYAGVLRTRPISASSIERVLADYFGVPVRLEQFVGCWDAIPAARRSVLGVTRPVLGQGAALGVRLWRHDLHARLHIGPLDESQMKRFLPGGPALLALQDMTALFAVPGLQYELRLLLAPPCVQRLTLSTTRAPRRLGWTAFLTGTAGTTQRPEIRASLRLAQAQAPRPGAAV